MDARDALTDLVKSIQKNMVNARTDESKGPSGRGRTGAALDTRLLAVRALQDELAGLAASAEPTDPARTRTPACARPDVESV